MKRVTMKAVREMARKYGCDFYKGNGYYYFTSEKYIFEEEGVYVYRLNSLSLEQWQQELEHKIHLSEN